MRGSCAWPTTYWRQELKDYHYIWLANHRNRTEEWLKERLADGFDIHHADGDHSNNDPSNLVLIESTDHMRLHGSCLNRLLIKLEPRHQTIGKQAYDMKDNKTSWAEIGAELNPSSVQPAAYARSAAKEFAEKAWLPFPKPNSNVSLACRALLHRMEPYA